MSGRVAMESDPEWEYAHLRLPPDVSKITAAVQLGLHAEYGGWELARVARYADGTRRVWLRRKRRLHPELLPLPRLTA